MKQYGELSLKYDIATECTSVSTQERATLLGYAVMVLLQSKKYSLFQILTIQYWIEQAIALSQIKFFFDWDGSPIGYVTWAYLAQDVEHRLVNDNGFLLHFSEWNEGSDEHYVIWRCINKYFWRFGDFWNSCSILYVLGCYYLRIRWYLRHSKNW
jgi:hemolysin-activating ACP:hemolysin acyltransferase